MAGLIEYQQDRLTFGRPTQSLDISLQDESNLSYAQDQHFISQIIM